jgi:hypothetical protein
VEWVGFFFLVALGGYLLWAGVAVGLFTTGFTGRASPWTVVFLALGGVMLYLAFEHAPFTIVTR